MGKTLEAVVDERSPRVAYLSEVGYDTDYFNTQAYDNLVTFLSRDTSLTHILIDGAVTRLDRPEYLNEQLTFWNKSAEECRDYSESTPNREQYKTMMDTQLEIITGRLTELRKKVPHAELVLSIHGEDLQYTASAMLNEKLIRGQMAITDRINKKKSQKKKWQTDIKKKQQTYDGLEGVKGSGNQRGGLKRGIDSLIKKVGSIDGELTDLYEERKIYREKKVRPSHQFHTRELIEEITVRYQELCDSLDIALVTGQTVLDLGGMKVDYSHSRHTTWNVIKSRYKHLMKQVHGNPDTFEKIDVFLESGHFGMGYKQLQKLKDHPDETNFKNQSAYDSITSDSHVTVVMALPFEDQQFIGEYVKGRQPARLSGGKPIGTRKIAAIDRYDKGGVSGLTIISKEGFSTPRTEWIQYLSFKDGSILEQPGTNIAVMATSDEHKSAPESNPVVLDGAVALYNQLMSGFCFRGSDAFVRGYINGGDVAEANSKKWDHRYFRKRDPNVLMRENLELLVSLNPKDPEQVMSLARKMTDDSMGGSVENMRVVLRWVADYLEQYLNPTLQTSDLKAALVATTGNHADAILRDVGFKEYDIFAERCDARGIGVFESGEPAYHVINRPDPRVYLGGYSNARVINIPDYGISTDGTAMFGPVNLVVQHDPKGSWMAGPIGAGKSADADVVLAGHTHDNKMMLYRREDNTFSVAYRLATLQGVTPTEKYYSGLPRTQAAHILVMSAPGDFSEQAVPASDLAVIGKQALSDELEKHLK